MRIELVPYQDKWATEFKLLQNKLSNRLTALAPVIEHIGSTSVPGLWAKPILDIMVGLKSEEELDQLVPLLEGDDFHYIPAYNAGTPFRRFFIGVKSGSHEGMVPHKDRSSHIHAVPVHSDWWREHLLFRDYLISDARARNEYAEVKRELSRLEWKDGNEYAAAKQEIICRILEEAKKARGMKGNSIT